MEILNYLTGEGGFILLALIALFALLNKRYKSWRYFKHIEKQRENKDN